MEDCWNDSYSGAPSDGSAWSKGECEMRVLRGGSWVNAPVSVRSAYRFRSETDFWSYRSSFRVARTLP